jgi:flagellar biosynthesis/type III secretory pathway protein FliH
MGGRAGVRRVMRRGQKEGWEEGWKEGWREGQKEGRKVTAEQWKSISHKVEAHWQGQKKERLQSQEGVQRRIWLVLRLV